VNSYLKNGRWVLGKIRKFDEVGGGGVLSLLF